MSSGQFILYLASLLLVDGVLSENNFYPLNRATKYLTDDSVNSSDYRLPGNLMPTLYDLSLQPFLDNATFNGDVTITFTVLNATDSVVLNVYNSTITIISAKLITSENQVAILNWTIDDVHDKVTFLLNGTIPNETDAKIRIVYSGVLRYDMLGFYISTYNTSDGLRKMAITQFESNYARRAFPCLDEPAYRAKFDVKIYRLQDQNSLANMPLQNSSPVNSSEWVLDTYETTRAMPTYLVAFGVSELAHKNSSDIFRVYARNSTLADAAYLLSVGQNILDTIGNFVNVSYPLPKMDVVAVPDFDAGAMENWGLCTYREKYVLWDSALNTWRDKFGVLSVNAHEFAHQWFGDLVTPLWWEYSWLNEAFATYFEYTIPNLVSSDWDIGSTEYVVSAVQPALDSDVGSPRPMTSPVNSTSQIEAIFDYVIYEKGGSILRMIENVLTTEVWKSGLNQYLTANSYKTGTPEELFSALEAAAGLDNLTETLNQWTTQPGFPLITVTATSTNITNLTSTQYHISQAPYNLNNQSVNYSWNVPLVYTTQWSKEFDPTLAAKHWLLPSVSNSSLLTVNHSGWIIVNVDQIGFYRVNYDIDNWILLKATLDSNLTEISDINRAQIVDDALHLARTGHLNYSTALSLTEFLQEETEPAPWYSFITNFKFLINQFYGTSTGDGLQLWARSLLTNLVPNLTSETYKGSLTMLLTSQFACDINLPYCVTKIPQLFNIWLQDTSYQIDPSLKQAVICTGLRLDTSGESFVTVWKYFVSSNNAAEQLLLLNAMGCTTNEDAIDIYLDAVCDVSSNQVRLQDRWIAFRALLNRQTGVLPGLKYLANNYDKVSNALGDDFSGVFNYLANTISQTSHIEEVQSLIKNTTLNQNFRNSLNTTVLNGILKRQSWAESSIGESVKTWVTANISSSASSVLTNICLTFAMILFVKTL